MTSLNFARRLMALVFFFGIAQLGFSQVETNPFAARSSHSDSGQAATGSAEPRVSGGPGFALPLPAFLINIQRDLNRLLSSLVQAVRPEGKSFNLGALLLVLLASFAYGIFHALGPGHGKSVVTTFFLGRPARIRQGLSMGYMIALIHAVVAIGVVSLILFILRVTFLTTFSQASWWIGMVSYGLIVILGLLMFSGAVVELASGGRRHLHFHFGAAAGHDHGDHHEESAHDEEHAHRDAAYGGPVTVPSPALQGAGASAAVPEGQRVVFAEPVTLRARELWGVAFATAIIPCPGAVTIMVFSVTLGLPLVGALAVGTLSVGMGITTSLAGILSILVRKGIIKAGSRKNDKPARVLAGVLRVGASALLLAIGLLLFLSALGT